MTKKRRYTIVPAGYKTWDVKEYQNRCFMRFVAKEVVIYTSFEKIFAEIEDKQFGLLNYQETKIALYNKDDHGNMLLISNDIELEEESPLNHPLVN